MVRKEMDVAGDSFGVKIVMEGPPQLRFYREVEGEFQPAFQIEAAWLYDLMKVCGQADQKTRTLMEKR